MKPLEPNLFVSGQITADDFQQLQAAGIKSIINNRPDNEEIGQLAHTEAQTLAQEHGIAYHYLPMSNGQPLTQELVDDFKQLIDTVEKPVLAHCRSGMRCSILWSVGKVQDKAISPDEAISAATAAGIPLEKMRSLLENVAEQSG